MLDVNAAWVGNRLLGAAGLIGSGTFLQGHAGDLLVLAGIVVAAVATWRSRSPQIVRQENTDLLQRLQTIENDKKTLEAGKIEMTAEIVELRSRPDIEALGSTLEKVAAAMTEQTAVLREIHRAVVPPEYARH